MQQPDCAREDVAREGRRSDADIKTSAAAKIRIRLMIAPPLVPYRPVHPVSTNRRAGRFAGKPARPALSSAAAVASRRVVAALRRGTLHSTPARETAASGPGAGGRSRTPPQSSWFGARPTVRLEPQFERLITGVLTLDGTGAVSDRALVFRARIGRCQGSVVASTSRVNANGTGDLAFGIRYDAGAGSDLWFLSFAASRSSLEMASSAQAIVSGTATRQERAGP
jgi:hypothetical protein